MDDVRAVHGCGRVERAALVGVSEGGPMSVLFAATYPSGPRRMVLVGTFARLAWAPDYPCGTTAGGMATPLLDADGAGLGHGRRC